MDTCKILSNASDDVLKTAIGTHSGTFHCDEALACGMLKLLPQYKDATIVRTRDGSILDKCAIVVDVGGVYDHKQHRYDHHQRSFDTVYSEIGCKTKLSSAGLVYKHYGQDIVREIAKSCYVNDSGEPIDVDEKDMQEIYEKVYRNFVEEIDGIDNGIEAFSEGKRNYAVTTTLSARVSRFNPSWNEPSDDDVRNDMFRKAMQLTQSEFVDKANGYFSSWLPARGIVVKTVTQCIEENSKILIFDDYCPWKSHLFDTEKALSAEGQILYVLYPEDGSTRETGKWRVQAAPASQDSFAQRKSLPSVWRGLRDDDLSAKSGVDGCVFVHSAGFIGGNKSFDGALKMAQLAVDFVEPSQK